MVIISSTKVIKKVINKRTKLTFWSMELKKQMEDVRNAVGHLQICLNLLMHDKEQFIKEFGEDAYNVFTKAQRNITAFEAKAHNDKVWYFKD